MLIKIPAYSFFTERKTKKEQEPHFRTALVFYCFNSINNFSSGFFASVKAFSKSFVFSDAY